MLNQSTTIVNKLGLHARAAAKFCNQASLYQSDVLIKKGSLQVNGKSIMGVMMLAASRGTDIELSVDGEDESQAMQALIELIQNRFGEDE